MDQDWKHTGGHSGHVAAAEHMAKGKHCVIHRGIIAPTVMGLGSIMEADDSFHSPTVIPPSALDKPSIMKRYHHQRTTMWGVTARSPTMVTLHDTQFVEGR